MITFKVNETKPTEYARVTELMTCSGKREEENKGLRISFEALQNYDNDELAPIVKGLYSTKKKEILSSLEEFDTLSSFKGNIEKLEDKDIEQILILSDLNQLVERNKYFEFNDLVEIRKKSLETLYFIFKNSEINKSIEIFTKYEICPMIVHQLPDLHVPLILSILLDHDQSLIGQILSEIDFIMQKIEFYSDKYVDVYSVIQVLLLLFKHEAIFDMDPIIRMFNSFCWRNMRLMDMDYKKFFYFDFLNNIKSSEFFDILSTTNFFETSTKYFTNLSILNYNNSEFLEFINNYNIKPNFLTERGMTTDFNSESIRSNILEIMIHFIENGHLDQFINTCFPDIFNNLSYSEKANKDTNSNLKNLSLIIKLASFVIPTSEKNRLILINSNFHKMMSNISSFYEKVFISMYISYFIPFEFDIIEKLDNQFHFIDLCNDIIFAENDDAIIASVNIFSLILNIDPNGPNAGRPLCNKLFETLINEDVTNLLEEIATKFNVEDTAVKAQNLVIFIKKMTESEE